MNVCLSASEKQPSSWRLLMEQQPGCPPPHSPRSNFAPSAPSRRHFRSSLVNKALAPRRREPSLALGSSWEVKRAQQEAANSQPPAGPWTAATSKPAGRAAAGQPAGGSRCDRRHIHLNAAASSLPTKLAKSENLRGLGGVGGRKSELMLGTDRFLF